MLLIPLLSALVGQPEGLVAEERVPIAVVVNTPTGKAARISRSEIIRIIDGLLKRHTDFFSQPVDEQVIEDCTGSLACIALTTRRDYEREISAAGDRVSFDGYLARLDERGLEVPRLMLMVSNVAGSERGDKLSVLLLDLDGALRLYHDAERKPGFEDEVEIEISEKAILAQSRPALVLDEPEANAVLTRAFERGFEEALRAAGHWAPFGEIRIALNVVGVGVEIEGHAIGQFDATTGTIRGVRPGRRKLTFRRADYEVAEREVEVTSNAAANLEVTLLPKATSDAGVIHSAVLWGGAATVAIGAALVVYGLTRVDSGVTSHCFAGTPDCASRNDFISFGFDANANGVSQSVNPGGVLVVPLGYSLAATGATWSLGALTFERDAEIPWISIAVGAVVGVLGYGLSAAL